MATDPTRHAHSGSPAGKEMDADNAQARKVTFLPLALKHQNAVEPLKLEVEEATESANSPQNMWQVYALGGFMVLSWCWGRWKERRRSASP